MKCSIDNCDNRAKARGLCDKHYCRLKRTGNPYHVSSHDPIDVRVRSLTKKDSATDCIHWIGTKGTKGYGTITVSGRVIRAHRLIWELARGDIPRGMCVCHTCDTRDCVNIKHLFLGTHAENMQDMKKKGRAHRNLGEKHPMAKLSGDQIVSIRKDQRSQRKIAKEYSVSQSTIWRIVKGIGWTTV